MASLRFSKKSLASLLGKKLSDAEITESLTLLGMPVDGIDGDEVLVDVTPNRPDMYSVEGVARALSAFLGLAPGLREYAAEDSGMAVEVDASVKKVRPFIACAVARNVPVDDELLVSLIALQEKLHDTVGRKRRKVAIGFTDLDKLAPPFTYRAVGPREVKFIPLEQKEEWTPERILAELKQGRDYGYIIMGHKKYPLIADSAGNVVALPPIITAEKVKVTPGTRAIFIDVTGTSEHAVNDALTIICCALADRGAEIGSVSISRDGKKEATPRLAPRDSTLRLKRMNALLGREFSAEEVVKLLSRMGHAAEAAGTAVSVLSPCYRTDLLNEADLFEDVAIPFGYNNFEPTLPSFVTSGAPSAREERTEFVRELLLGLGYTETLQPFLSSEEAQFKKTLAPGTPAARIKNPLTENATLFRTWCIPSLLETLALNKNAPMPQKVFELGDVAVIEKGKPVETRKLACAICGPKASFNEMRSAVEALYRELGIAIKLEPLKHPTFIPGRAATVMSKGEAVGAFGEIHPQVLNNFGIEQPTAVFEMECCGQI